MALTRKRQDAKGVEGEVAFGSIPAAHFLLLMVGCSNAAERLPCMLDLRLFLSLGLTPLPCIALCVVRLIACFTRPVSGRRIEYAASLPHRVTVCNYQISPEIRSSPHIVTSLGERHTIADIN
jgi:hypothetical protein